MIRLAILMAFCVTCAFGQCPIAAPSTYLVRTDRAILSDASVPSWGGANTGAGTINTDTTYYAPGIRTVRVTDGSTVISGANHASQTNGTFNCDSTKFWILADNGFVEYWSFNRTTLATARIASPVIPGGGVIQTSGWSLTDPNLGILLITAADQHMVFASWNFQTSTYTLLHDPKTDIPSIGSFGSNLVFADKGNCLGANLSGTQDLRRYFYLWCAATQDGYTAGARWLDGTTGIVSGWGSTGSISSGVTFGGHNMGLRGTIAIITIGVCLGGSPCTNNADGFLWDILKTPATATQFFSISGSDYPISIQGHIREDDNNRVFDDTVLNGGAFDRTLRQINSSLANFNVQNANEVDLIPVARNPDTFNSSAHTTLVGAAGTTQPFFDDVELSGSKITSIARASGTVTVNMDRALFCTTSDSFTIRNVTGGSTSFDGTFAVASVLDPPNCTQFTFTQAGADESGTVDITSAGVPVVGHPWDREIIGVSTDGSNTIYRFAHIYGPSLTSPSFTLFPSIGISSDGRFMIFHSDMAQTLGTETSSGVNRTDVFIMELPAASNSYGSGVIFSGVRMQ